MGEKKISIIIPAKNCGKTISETLNSIKNQTFKNFEVIIVDDGSVDDTRKVIDAFNKRENVNYNVISLGQGGGASKARNTGAAHAKGDILVFADSDIILSENALEEGMKFKEKNKDVSGFSGSFNPRLRFNNILSQYKNLYLCYVSPMPDENMSSFDTSLCFIDKSLFEKFKFNENIRYMSEDTDLAMRMIKNGYINIRRIPEVKMDHLKQYTLKSFVKSEYVRGKAFSRLFLRSVRKDKKECGKNTFYLRPLCIYMNVGVMPFFILFIALFLITNNPVTILFSGVILLSIILLNIRFWNYIRKIRGLPFALISVIISFFDIIIMDIGITATVINLLVKRKSVLG